MEEIRLNYIARKTKNVFRQCKGSVCSSECVQVFISGIKMTVVSDTTNEVNHVAQN